VALPAARQLLLTTTPQMVATFPLKLRALLSAMRGGASWAVVVAPARSKVKTIESDAHRAIGYPLIGGEPVFAAPSV